jgi:hypothetical protein
MNNDKNSGVVLDVRISEKLSIDVPKGIGRDERHHGGDLNP